MLTLPQTPAAVQNLQTDKLLHSGMPAGEQCRYRDLDTNDKDDKSLRPYDLFSIFTANVILLDVTFTR